MSEVWGDLQAERTCFKIQTEADHTIRHFRFSSRERKKYPKDILYQLAELDLRDFYFQGPALHICLFKNTLSPYEFLIKHVHLG